MKKKLCLKIFLITIFTTIIIGCTNFNINTFNNKKPDKNYYTQLLSSNIMMNSRYRATVLETNYYDEKNLDSEDINTIKKFLSELNKNNFIDLPKDLPPNIEYRLFFTFDKEKYIVDIYNSTYAAVFPWDGSYNKDYINMNNIHTAFNLYNLCKYKQIKIPSK